MNFLLVLAAIVIEFGLNDVVTLRSPDWSGRWADWAMRQGRDQRWWRGWPAALLVIGVPVAATAVLFAVLFSLAHLLGHAVSLAVLVWMLGPADLRREIEQYRRSLGLGAAARATLGSAFTVTTAGLDLGPATGDDPFDAARGELAALALSAERGWFAPMFWFFVLGPLGAVLYRLCANLERAPQLEASSAHAIAQMHEALAWLPGRITALTLGIAGTLVPVLEELRAVGVFSWGRTGALVARASLAAIDHGRIHAVDASDPQHYRLNQMQALVRRALNVWLVVLALIALWA